MTGTLVVLWLILSFLNAGVFDPLDMQNYTASNADDACNDLAVKEDCEKVGPCVWDPDATTNKCSTDICFERTYLANTACKNTSCVKVSKFSDPPANPPEKSYFCVAPGRETLFDTQDKVCSLEWGAYKFVELAACNALSVTGYGCGPVDKIQGTNTSHYVCKAGTPPADPCAKITDAKVCPYVGDCMYVGESCITDPCWEKTLSTNDGCKTLEDGTVCEKHLLNPGGNVILGYCKTPSHDLNSVCNVGTASNFITKEAVCSWPTITNVPTDCKNVATINNYDGGTLYVCNPTDEDFTVPGSAGSLKPFVAALCTLVLLIMML